MKAKAMEIPTSRWPVLFILVALLLWVSFDNIKANEVKTVNNTVDTIGTFESVGFVKDSKTTFDIQDDIAAGATLEAERKALVLEQENQKQQELENNRLLAIAQEEARYSTLGVCGYLSGKKTYMDYRAIHPSSTQMYIINSQTSVREDGLLVTDDGFVAVALGSYYGPLGGKFRITTDTGQVFKVIKVDEKSDQHTTGGCQDSSGAIIEFVIDTNLVRASYPQVTTAGDFDSLTGFHGTIMKIEKYN